MENKPIGRVKKIVSGGSGLKRSGKVIEKDISQRNVKRGEGPSGIAGSTYEKNKK